MPLPLLILTVVTGLTLIWVALRLTGRSAAATLDTEAARAAWLREAPDDPIEAVDLSSDGRAALVRAASGAGLVWVIGADTTVRRARDVQVTQREDGLYLRMRDFTAPALSVTLDPEAQRRWADALGGGA